MYIKIKTIKQTPNKYGNDLTISKVGLYDSDDKFTKWIKLNDVTMEILQNAKIQIEDHLLNK